jgi:hypothetical protein
MLEASIDPETLSNRVVHVSVQLFSNESLAVRMVEQLNLLHVMVISLKRMMSNILIQSTLHGVYNVKVCCYVLCCVGWLETKLVRYKCVEVTIQYL